MPIVCGTDFTDASVAAVTAASQLAVRMSLPLHLVHVVKGFIHSFYGVHLLHPAMDGQVVNDRPTVAA